MPSLDIIARRQLSDRVLSLLASESDPSDSTFRQLIGQAVAERYCGTRMNLQERQLIAEQLYHVLRGLDLLQPMMDDSTITEIMVNGPNLIFYERSGLIHKSDLHFDGQQHLLDVILNLFNRGNRLLNESHPIADMRLPCGARAHAVLSSVAPDGPILSIRKFTGIRPDLAVLEQQGFITAEGSSILRTAVIARKSIFISGGTGTGKTTLLNALSGCIDPNERVITIEDAAELNLQGLQNKVRLEARILSDSSDSITISQLIRAALRMRPDRLIVGEVRGSEAFDMLSAMNTGHQGSLSTGHGNSCADMLSRLAVMTLGAVDLPFRAILHLIAATIDLVVHLHRSAYGFRTVAEIARINRVEGDAFVLDTLYTEKELSLNDP
jgi:pilus assembly protein CpaF